MSNTSTLLYHIAANSTSYILVMLGAFIALYEVWQNYEKIKKNIFLTVVYTIIFIFGIFEIINFQIVIICCSNVKKKINRLKLLLNVIEINGILEAALEDFKINDKFLASELATQFSSLIENINKIKEMPNKRDNENSSQTIADNRNMERTRNKDKKKN